MPTELYRVALIGRPNVGKSTLFNRLIGRREAVVADQPGTTRDRLEGSVQWQGSHFQLIDMAGVELTLTDDSEIREGTQAQVAAALDLADLLIWVVDGREGLTPADLRVTERLRKTGKPFILAVNKCDHPRHDEVLADFARAGGGGGVTLSALHGRGINELLDAILPYLDQASKESLKAKEVLAISIIGRPNVGKSTLLNALVGEKRAVVADQPGTTRDAVDTLLPALKLFGSKSVPWEEVRIIDTAGIRRKGRVEPTVERWSIERTLKAVENSMVVLFLLDGDSPLSHQDLRVAEEAVSAGKALILVVNKWDLVQTKESGQKEEERQAAFLDRLRRKAPFLHWAQVIFISALEGYNLKYLGNVILNAFLAWSKEITEVELNEFAKELKQGPRFKTVRRLKFVHSRPPVFEVYTAGSLMLHFSKIRALENELRQYFKLGPAPIKIWVVPERSPKRREEG